MSRKNRPSRRPRESRRGEDARDDVRNAPDNLDHVTDSEDDFLGNKDKLSFEDEPDSKRRKAWREEGMV